MKKPLIKIAIILLCLVAGVVISGVVYSTTGFLIFGIVTDEPAPSPGMANAELTSLAYTVLGYINDEDYISLSRVAHPELGIVFSPYATIALTTNKCFMPDQIAAFSTDTTLYVWGVYNGSGEPIKSTPGEYFDEFIFARDYAGSSIIGVNKIVRSGNALENITDVFPDIEFVDFHISNGERDSNGDYDWVSLRFGFEVYEGSLRLTLIQHSCWTA